MKHTLFCSALLLALAGAQAQTLSPLKTFRSKEAKVRANNLHSIEPGVGGIELTAFLKKGSAEKLRFNNDLILQSRIDTAFDFEAEEKKKKQSFWESFAAGAPGYTKTYSDVLKSDVLEITSSDALSKSFGANIVNKGKIGLKSSPAFAVQKGDVKLITNITNYGEGDMRGNTTRTSTVFEVKEEIKLKSDEGKNLLYEFHSSNAEAIQVAFRESYSRRQTYSNKSFGSQNMKTLISEEGDLLLVGKRKPVVKFGKAPSAEDLLPVYYVYRISPKKMDVTDQGKFSEPVARAVIFRETLPKNKGILLVSAPTDITGDKSPTDPNPRNYVFRVIGEDTKVKQEFIYEVPSGQTQFAQALEMPDGSIVLTGITNLEKKDKFINKGTLPMAYDAFFTMVIKDGKVVSNDVVSTKDFQSGFITAKGEKANAKNVWMPTHELVKNVSNIELADGGLVSAWTATSLYGGGYAGEVVLHFSPQGKLLGRYWVPSKNAFMPALGSELFRKNDKEFYLVTHTNNDKGELEESRIVKIDLASGSMGQSMLLGDEKHVLTEKLPYVQLSDNELQVFGFDKGGKEFWTQKVVF